MCLLACLLEIWANSHCYDWMTKKCHRHRRECRARFQYKLEKWRAVRSRKKWLKREQEHREEVQGDNSCDILLSSSRKSSEASLSPLQRLEIMNYKNAEGIKDTSTTEVASFLSPGSLTKRLSENALAQEAVGESDTEVAQYLKDERVALFLQNDEFISELRSNQEFMSALQRDYDEDNLEAVDFGTTGNISKDRKRTNNEEIKLSSNLMTIDDATFKARIATMSKASRKKFAQIAKVFSRNKKSSGSKSVIPTITSGRDLLISPDPLLEECDEESSGSLSADGRNTKSFDFNRT